jgi:GMP synthase-like glutamine amidotransferase
VLAGSAFTPYGVLAYDDAKAISMQFHPEFDAGLRQGALIEARRGTRYHRRAGRRRHRQPAPPRMTADRGWANGSAVPGPGNPKLS